MKQVTDSAVAASQKMIVDTVTNSEDITNDTNASDASLEQVCTQTVYNNRKMSCNFLIIEYCSKFREIIDILTNDEECLMIDLDVTSQQLELFEQITEYFEILRTTLNIDVYTEFLGRVDSDQTRNMYIPIIIQLLKVLKIIPNAILSLNFKENSRSLLTEHIEEDEDNNTVTTTSKRNISIVRDGSTVTLHTNFVSSDVKADENLYKII